LKIIIKIFCYFRKKNCNFDTRRTQIMGTTWWKWRSRRFGYNGWSE